MVQSDELLVDKLLWFSKEHKGSNLNHGIPKAWLSEKYEKLLFAIRNSFTCEGIFDTVYQFHFKLLLHFIGKTFLDIPFYLYRSLGKMAHRCYKNSGNAVL